MKSILLLGVLLAQVTFANEVVNCIRELKSYQGFNNDQAAMACSGAKSANEVVNCIRELKSYQGFNNDQAAMACKTNSCR